MTAFSIYFFPTIARQDVSLDILLVSVATAVAIYLWHSQGVTKCDCFV